MDWPAAARRDTQRREDAALFTLGTIVPMMFVRTIDNEAGASVALYAHDAGPLEQLEAAP